jgi:hypothetical protein
VQTQFGDNNEVLHAQNGFMNGASTTQNGNMHMSTIKQTGSNNNASVFQSTTAAVPTPGPGGPML